MTNKTKMIVGVVGIGLVAYYLWSRKKSGKSILPLGKSSSFSGDENFFNLKGGGSTLPSESCGDGCDNGKCKVPIYDANGNVTYRVYSCRGTKVSEYPTTI